MQGEFMLVSRHKAVLGAAQDRYDASYKYASRLGFWRGFSAAIWVGGVAVYITALAAFTLGANL